MTPKEYFHHQALCSLPWIGAFIEPNGNVRNCAINMEILGNMHQQSIKQCLLGTVNEEIKTDMLNNVKHKRCSACYNVENYSSESVNSISNRHWYRKSGIKFVDQGVFDQAQNFKLNVLDLRWRNTCNQACVYCGPDLSSRWAVELNDMSNVVTDEALTENKNWILDNLDTVNHVYLAGGEPLLIKENIELLERLLPRQKDISIRINTNLSNIETKVFDYLMKFDNVKWTISVDTIEDQYNYIRYPGNWKIFVENLLFLQKNNADINFNLVWFILNSESIFDCFNFLQALGFHENTFIAQPLVDPPTLGIWHLPNTRLEAIKKKIKNQIEKTDSSYWLYKSLVLMYNFIDVSKQKDLAGTRAFLNDIDQRRQLNHNKIFTNLYDQ